MPRPPPQHKHFSPLRDKAWGSPPFPGSFYSPHAFPIEGTERRDAAMDDIFTQCREGNAVAVRLWLDNTENDLNQG